MGGNHCSLGYQLNQYISNQVRFKMTINLDLIANLFIVVLFLYFGRRF